MFCWGYSREPFASKSETFSTPRKTNTQFSIEVVVLFVAANNLGDGVEDFWLHIQLVARSRQSLLASRC